MSITYKNADGTYTHLVHNQTYTIATNAFTAKGGDGFTVLAKAYGEGRVTDLGLSDWENFRDHLVSLGTVNPQLEGRIVDVVGKEAEIPGGDIAEEDFSGTPAAPKTYAGDVTIEVSDVASIQNAVVKGNLTITGAAIEELSLENLTIEGNLNLSGIDANVNLKNVKITGETIF